MVRLIFSALLLGLLVACQSTAKLDPKDRTLARFFLESGEGVTGMRVVLPQSAVNLAVNPKPVLTEGDILNVELVQVDLGKCLLFQLTPSAARDFYRLSGTHQGRRLVLMINDEAIGARRIDGAIPDGRIFVFVEQPDAELPALVSRLKLSSTEIQREIARKG